MRNIFFLILLCFVLLSTASQSTGTPKTPLKSFEKKNVLVLHSYSESFKWTHDIMQALKGELTDSDIAIELYAEYLDTKRFPDRAYWQHLIDSLVTKYRATPINLIITSDNNALDFLFQYRHYFFPDVPVVFCGLNNFKPEMLEKQEEVTGIAESTNLKATIDLAQQLHPETEQLVFIASSARSSVLNLNQLYAIRSGLKSGLPITVWKDNSIEEIEDRVQKLNTNAIIFILARVRNSNGEYLNSVQMGQRVSTASRVPVYSLWDFYLGTGIVGGKLVNGKDQGLAAAKMALSVLNGVPISDIPVITDTPTSYMFDYPQLKRFSTEFKKLPSGSILINEPYSFYEVNKTMVWVTLIVFFILSMLIIFLFLNIMRRRKAEKVLQKHQKNLEIIIKERTKDLRKNEQLLKLTGQMAKVGGWELNAETSEVSWTEETYNIHEIPLDQKPPLKRAIEFYHPDDRPKLELAIQEAIDNGKPYEMKVRFITAKGNRLWTHTICKPVVVDGKTVKLTGTFQDITASKQLEIERERLIDELKEALMEVKTLSGLLPICAHCKKIRDDKGYWNTLEAYIEKHSEAEFSHGMCSECSDKFYGNEDWYLKMKKVEESE